MGALAACRAVLCATLYPQHTLTIANLERIFPTSSQATIHRVLEELRQQNLVECLGTGCSARWLKVTTRS